ncbi:hybrid sensor histidine kinase/response regulator [Roseomonas elaeocarpi]|uniref:histidine kinase n=1 Tax=Roseomonas elaeocarpi TaxID=907779 RepID=A0ABV6JPQ4_9PROT
MEDFRAELLAAFAVEYREHLEVIRRLLDAAEAGQPLDLRDGFRRVHSLKGAARAVDLPVVEEVAHRLEAFFARLLDGSAVLGGGAAAVVSAALDAIEGHVSALSEGGAGAALPVGLTEALDGLLDGGAGRAGDPPAGSPPPGSPPPASSPQGFPTRGDATQGSSSSGSSSSGSSSSGSSSSGRPPAPAAPATATDTAQPPAEAPAAGPATEAPALGHAGPGEYLRIGAAQVDALSGAMHELSAMLQRQEAMNAAILRFGQELRALRRQWGEVQPQLRDPAAAADRAASAATPAGRFDARFAALSRHFAALTRDGSGIGWALHQSARRLRTAVEQLSLVPAEAVLGSLARTVRDLARSEGREVAVRLEGLDQQADRAVLQSLKDPLLHLLRNAVGHGRESPEARRAAGKPERGEVGLHVASRGGQLVLRVWDDGAGPDLLRIEETAVRQGLLPHRANDAPPPPEDRLLELVFEPGFSTAGEVDRLSGRGMGLSVVAEAVRALRGNVQLRPRRGVQAGVRGGTEVVIAVPFSAARQPVLLFQAGGSTFALPSYGAERLLHLSVAAVEVSGPHRVARLTLDGQEVVVPLVALTALLGLPPADLVGVGVIQAVLLRRGNRRCLLAVDSLRDVRTLLVGPLDAPGVDPELFAGVVMLDDMTAAPLLRPEGLVERWTRLEAHGAAAELGLAASPAEASPRAVSRQTTVLVVDDSITTRTLERSILEAQGYRVALAVDGLEALNLLRGGEAVVDLVLADVEMPRMDGFALLQAIKADALLASLPVILMTSRADPEDVRRGLELGAGAYLTKQRFDQRELLATIGQLL